MDKQPGIGTAPRCGERWVRLDPETPGAGLKVRVEGGAARYYVDAPAGADPDLWYACVLRDGFAHAVDLSHGWTAWQRAAAHGHAAARSVASMAKSAGREAITWPEGPPGPESEAALPVVIPSRALPGRRRRSPRAVVA